MHRLLLLLALSGPVTLHAQDAEPPSAELSEIPVAEIAPPALPVEDEAVQLDELVVTAQRVKQPMRKVPLSITALGGDFISATGAADLADVSLYVPNVRVDADDLGSPQVFIRGFGTNAFNPSFEASVAFVQDELFFGRPGYFTEAMFDIDRVEVLRGPQGTLFGKNSVAGVFNVTSKGPEQDSSAEGRVFGGQDGELRYEAGVGGFVTDWLGGRAAGLHRQQDGQLYNQFQGRMEDSLEQDAGRVKAVLYPGLGLRAELMGVESRTEAPFWPFQLMKLDDDTRDYLDDFDPAIEDDPRNFVTSFDTPGFIEKGSETFGGKIEWDGGTLGPLQDFAPVLVLGSSTFYIDQLNELDVSPADIARLDNHEDHKQETAELRFSGRFDSLFGLGTGLEFVAGAFKYESNYVLLARIVAGADLGSYVTTADAQQLIGAPGSGVGGGFGLPTAPLTANDDYQFDFVQDVQSEALFAQFTWYLTDQWAITPGLRYSREDKRVDTAGTSHCEGKAVGQPCFMAQLLEAVDYGYAGLTRSEADLSPKFALQYFGDVTNYYVSYARGYKSGGFNSLSFGQVCDDPADPSTCRTVRPDELDYEPETARTIEIGAKARSEGGTLALNVTRYETRFDNLQLLAFNGFLFDVSNAGKARSRGWEADFQWITLYEPLRLIGSIGLLKAQYLDYPGAPAPIGEGIGATQNLAGQRIAFAPRHTGTLTPTLTYLFGDFITTFAADALYQGGQFTDTDLDPNTYQRRTVQYAGRATFAQAGGLWGVTLGGTNLTDERILNQVTDAPFFPGTFFAQQAGGRQLFATVQLSF
ncbi:MAG TPA: TonB-dependent receptor [Verrucomicrobiae bacterium]|nr:TonB-dependent receptor [Verrucomicrobiae bacterium]